MRTLRKKPCSKCGVEEPMHEFHNAKLGKWGKAAVCKTCKAAYKKEEYQQHRDRYKANSKAYWDTPKGKEIASQGRERARKYYLLRAYKLTEEAYDSMLKAQNGACAVCGGINTYKHRLYVDHNHATGELRGLLCGHCNFLIGHARESEEIMLKAIAYLKHHNSRAEE